MQNHTTVDAKKHFKSVALKIEMKNINIMLHPIQVMEIPKSNLYKKKPKMSKHLMSNYLKERKRIALFKKRRLIFADGCGDGLVVHKQFEPSIIYKPELERIYKCRKHDAWKVSLKTTALKTEPETEPDLPEESKECEECEWLEWGEQEWQEWEEERFWGRI